MSGGRILFVIVAVATFVADRIAKVLVQTNLEVGERVALVNGLLELRHVHNRGIAFGLFSGAGSIVVVGTLLVGILLFVFLLRVEPEDHLTILGGSLITGGALGNLVDRLQYRHVIDFIHVTNWPTFNIADIGITVGVVLVLLAQFAAMRREHRAATAAANEDGGTT